MLAERMRREDVLSEQLEALRRQLERAATVQEQLEAAAVESRVHWDHERSNLFEERKVGGGAGSGGFREAGRCHLTAERAGHSEAGNGRFGAAAQIYPFRCWRYVKHFIKCFDRCKQTSVQLQLHFLR